MPLKRNCCVRNCNSKSDVSYHGLPADAELNLKWKVLINHTDYGVLSDYALVCSDHFTTSSFSISSKRKMLTTGAVPSIFKDTISVSSYPENFVLGNLNDQSNKPSGIFGTGTQTKITSAHLEDLLYTKKCLTQKLKRVQIQTNRLKVALQLEKDKNCIFSDTELKSLKQIKKDVGEMEPQAVFLLDQIINYKKKIPRFSEITIRHCIAWRFSSVKGYEFPRNSLLKLPCRTTLKKYIGINNGNLIKDRLLSEILSAPEKVCSLVLDDMAARESLLYSKVEDRIYGSETISTDASIGTKPVMANKLLCFVIRGLSTKYVIPASYHFHRQLSSKELYKLTLDVLKLLADCDFKVIRIVADNHKYHVALFKHFGNGILQNSVPHPFMLLVSDTCANEIAVSINGY